MLVPPWSRKYSPGSPRGRTSMLCQHFNFLCLQLPPLPFPALHILVPNRKLHILSRHGWCYCLPLGLGSGHLSARRSSEQADSNKQQTNKEHPQLLIHPLGLRSCGAYPVCLPPLFCVLPLVCRSSESSPPPTLGKAGGSSPRSCLYMHAYPLSRELSEERELVFFLSVS